MRVSKMTDFYHNVEDIHPTISTWVHINMSVLHFFVKRYILLKGMFVEAFSPMIMKNKSVNFLMKSVETP